MTLRAGAVGNGGVRLPNRSEKRRGVILSANADTQVLMASVSGTAGIGTAGVSGVVNTLVIKNTVKATVGENGVIEAGFSEEEAEQASGDDAEAAIESSDETDIYNLAGGISVGGSAGVGTTVVTMVHDKSMEASVGAGGTLHASGSVRAAAESTDDVYLLALSFAGSGTAGVSVGASTLAFENDLLATLGGTVTAGGNVDVTARSSTDLFNVATAFAAGGSAGVTPVAVVTWFAGSTVAEFGEGAVIQADGNVTLAADSEEFITSDAAGVSVGGAASVSGTVDILISDQVTRAQAQKNVSITGKKLDISALDDTQVLAIAATGAFSGTAAVGVTAVVSVLHNTVTAGMIGGEAGENDVDIGGTVNVLADAKRDVLSYAGSAAVSAGAGVGTTIMVTVAGGKLSQDSSDALLMSGDRLTQEEYDALSEDEQEEYRQKTKGGFDPDGFVSNAFSGSYTLGYRMDGLAGKLEGDGVKQSDIQLGGKDGNFDAESGYVSEDFYSDEEATADNANRGENFEVNEKNNVDLSEAAAIAAAKYDPKSAVSAVIGSGVSITAGGDIYVRSDELVSSDMIAASLAGGIAGVGSALAVNVVYSNVIAGVDENTSLSADGLIQIHANSGTVECDEGSDSGEQERNNAISGLVKGNDGSNKLDLSSRTIRSIAVVGSGGVAAVSVSGSVVVLGNNTIAYLDGSVTKATSLSVTADSDYPSILCVTGAGSGGVAAVNGFFAVIYHEGKVEARIAGNGSINGVKTIEVKTNANTEATAASIAVSGGVAAVNAGVAVVESRIQADTYVGKDVSVGSALTKLTVTGTSNTEANAWLTSVTGGVAGVGVAGAVTIVSPKVYTYIGVAPDSEETASGTGKIAAENAVIQVSNDVTSSAAPLILSANGGIAGVGTNVLLSFNDTDAVAGIIRKNIVAASIDVDAKMDAHAETIFSGANAGAVPVGVSVSYARLGAKNGAILDATGVEVEAASISVTAGKEESGNSATVKAVSVSNNIGASTGTLNVAIADNCSSNIARIFGNDSTLLTVKSALLVQAVGEATAEASVAGMSIGLSKTIAASAAVAVLRSTQEATIRGGKITTGTLTVQSLLNGTGGDSAKASLLTGGGGMESVRANVAVAYGRSGSVAGVAADALTVTGLVENEVKVPGSVKVLSTGSANTLSSISNQDFAAISAGLMTGYAYAQGAFEAYLGLDEGDSLTADSVSVETSYTANATTHLTPSLGGVKGAMASINANVAVSNASSSACASIYGGGTISTGTVTVKADGTTLSEAVIYTPAFTVSKVDVAANVAVALLDASNKAQLDGVTVNDAAVTVQAFLNDGAGESAKARLGSSAPVSIKNEKGESVEVTLTKYGISSNIAFAKNNSVNEASMTGASVLASGKALKVESDANCIADPGIQEADVSVAYMSVGLTVIMAQADGSFKAFIDTEGGNIEVASVLVSNTYESRATAKTAPALGGCGDLSAVKVKANVASASVGTLAEAAIKGGGCITASGNVNVLAIGTVLAQAGVATATVDISGINIAANVVTAELKADQSAYIQGATIEAANVYVTSELNKNRTDGATAELGSVTSGSFSATLVGATSNTATATADASSRAFTSGASIDVKSGIVAIQSEAASNAIARVKLPASVAMTSIGVNVVTANANGTFQAYANGSSGSIHAGTVRIQSIYTSKANARTGNSVSVSQVSGQANAANAVSGTTAGAGVNLEDTDGAGDGEGDSHLSINAATITILADGTAEALAEVGQQTKVNLYNAVVNDLTSTVSGKQKAQLNHVVVDADTVSVTSKFNDSDAQGAVAVLGSATTGSISASGYSAKVNTVTAKMIGESEASANGAVITATGGAVTIFSDARSYAKAYTGATTANVGLVNIGAVKVDADADGSFAAEFNGSTVTSATLSVRSNFTARAEATAEQPKVSLSFASGQVNQADADAGASNTAAITGSDVTTTGKIGSGSDGIQVIGDGTATAFATIYAPKVSVSSNKLLISDVNASVSAKQEAFISGGSVKAKNNINITAWLNDNENQGAVAKLEATNAAANGQIIIANTADAEVTAENSAYVSGTSFGSESDLSGNLNILSSAKSYALASYTDSSYTANGANLGVMVMNANAKGTFEAWLDSTGANVYVKNISIKLQYQSNSEAKSTQPNGGFSIEGVKVATNKATATSGTKATGYVMGSGNVYIGNLDIQVDGSGSSATADVDGKEVSVSGVNVGLNTAVTNLSVTQNAYLEGSGTVNASGYVKVISKLDNASTTSELGSNGGANVSIISGGNQWAYANVNKMSNTAFIRGNVSIDTTGAVEVLAQTNALTVTARAEANNTSASLAALGVVLTQAKIVSMTTEAAIDGNANIQAGSVSIKAYAGTSGKVTQLISKAEVPKNSFSGVNTKVVQATAIVESNKTQVGVGSNAVITTTGDVTIYAETNTKMDARTNKTTSVGLAEVGRYEFKNTVKEQSTSAYLNGKVFAGNNLLVEAYDKVEADSWLNSTSIGAVSKGKNKVEMQVTQTSTVTMGEGADAEARNNVTLKANAHVDLHGIVNTTGVGLKADSEATVSLTWKRTQSITIGENARLSARYGNMNILCGDNSLPFMYADLDMDGGGIVGAGNGPKAAVVQTSETTISVGAGARITAVFGQLLMKTTDTTRATADAYRDMISVAGSNRSEADVTTKSTSNITLGANDPAAVQAYINARITKVVSEIIQKLNANATSTTFSGGSSTTAYADINSMDNEQIIGLYNVFLGGIDALYIEAETSEMENTAAASAHVKGASGKATAKSNVRINSADTTDTDAVVAKIYVSSLADVAGQDVQIVASAPSVHSSSVVNSSAKAKADTVTKWLVKIFTFGQADDGSEEAVASATLRVRSNVILNGRFHLGGAAAGGFVDIDEDGKLHYSGLDDQGFTQASDVGTVSGSAIYLNRLYNDDRGSLIAKAYVGEENASSKMTMLLFPGYKDKVKTENSGKLITIYDGSFLPNVVITNRSDRALYVNEVTLINGKQPRPNLDIGLTVSQQSAQFYEYMKMNFFCPLYAYELPSLSIVSEKDGDVIFRATDGSTVLDQDVAEGIVDIRMNGGLLSTAPGTKLWANKLTVTGAGSIGTEQNPFHAYITEIARADYSGFISQPERDAYISMQAEGDIWANIRHVLLYSEYANGKVYPINDPKLTLGEITSETGKVNLTIEAPGKVVAELQNNTDMDVFLPGNGNNFGDIGSAFGEDTYLRLSDYLLYTDSETGESFYMLPNELILRVSSVNGQLKFQSAQKKADGVTYDFSDLSFTISGGKVSKITYVDGNKVSKVIDFTGNNIMINIGQAGGTVYMTRDENRLVWTLPDGTHIYLSNVFTKEEDGKVTEVSPISIGNNLYLLEELSSGRTRYHVVELEWSGDSYSLVEGYIYEFVSTTLGQASGYNEPQSAEEARAAANTAVQNLQLTMETNSTSLIADAVAKAVAAVITADWKAQINVSVTGTDITGIRANISISVQLGPVADEDTEVGSIQEITGSKTYVNMMLTDKSDASASVASGTYAGNTGNLGVNFASGVVGNRKGTVSITKDGNGNVTSMTITNGLYTFDTTYNAELGAYEVVKPDSFGGKAGYEARYNELKGKYFTVTRSGNTYTIGFRALECKGEGAISDETLNGGYKKVNGGYLFVDNATDKTGIFYMEDEAKAVAFTRDGQFYYVNINYARNPDGSIIDDLSQATLMYGPVMVQAEDRDGLLYDENGAPLYTAGGQVHAQDASGKYLYVSADGTIFSHSMDFDTLMGDSGAMAEVLAKYGQFTAYYYYPKGTVTITPAGENGMNVTYMPYSESGDIRFRISSDSDGYGIVDRYTRVILDEGHSSGLPQGTLLYLDKDGKVVGAYTPNGLLRIYDKGSSLGGTEIYCEVNSSYIHMTQGAAFKLHQAATGVYMAPQSIGQVNMLADNSSSPVSRYFHSDYYSVGTNGLVQMTLGEILTMSDSRVTEMGFRYPNASVKELFDGAYVSEVRDANGELVMYVLERKDADSDTQPTTIILLPDGTWYASDSSAGVLQPISSRVVEDLEQTYTLVEMTETISGESITIIFGGENTSLNDKDDIVADSHTNVITNNLKIIAADNGNIFEEKDPIVFKPFSGDTCNIQIIGSIATSGAYDGEAYAKTLLEANVNLHDTHVGQNGNIDLEIYKGDAGLDNVIVNDGGELTVDVVNGGNVSMENVSVLGDGQGSEGKLTVSTAEGDLSLTDGNISGTASITSGGDGSITMQSVDVSGKLTMTNDGEGTVDMDDVDISGEAAVSTGEGDLSLTDADISGTASITSGGDGAITMQNLDISGELTMTNKGVGAVDMDNVHIDGEATVSTNQGDVDMDVITVAQGGRLELYTGNGSVTMGENGTASDNLILIDGTAEITSGTGKIHMNRVDVNQTGKLAIDTGKAGGNDNDVIVDAVYVDGLMTITTTGDPTQGSKPGSDLLMKNETSKLVLDTNFRETGEGEDGEEMFFDIGGNIGTPGCYFKVSYEGDDEKPSLTLNIRNANDIFLTQLTDIPTEIENGEDTGRLEGDSVKTEHDECISDLGEKEVQVLIPDQTPEELAKQLAGNLTEEQLLQFVDGKLSGAAVKDILELSEESIAEALNGMTSAQMEQLWNTVIGENSAPALEEKLTDVAAMREKLNAEGTDTKGLSDEKVQQAYESYYQQKRDDYQTQLSSVVLGTLSGDESLTGAKIGAMLVLSGKDASMEAVLVGVIGGEKIKVDQNGDPIQTVDASGAPLYLDKDGNLTTEAEDVEGNLNEPVYETEPLLDDETELFKAYWESLTDAQKQALVENAYEALVGKYPPVEDQTGKPRDLVLLIGTSTGESYLLNVGDITIRQSSGTFTAGEVVSTHGDVTITAPSIEGVAAEAKAAITDPYVQQMYEEKYVGERTENGTTTYGTDSNVYAENHSYTATEGGIGAVTELTTEQRSWKEDVIANIAGEEPLPGADDYRSSGSWDILRNENGEIEMNFVASFNGIRDIDLLTETTLNASAVGDIAITELTGNQMVNNVTSTAGSVTLKAPDGEMMIQHITAGGRADLAAQGSILDSREDGDAKLNVDAGSGSITSASGSIGAGPDDRIDVSIDGHLTTDSFGDTNLNALGSLNLTADTTEGILHVDGTGNLTIDNTDGDMNLGAIEAAGDVSITAQGGLVLGDRLGRDAQVKGDSISVTAGNGDVGTAEAPLLVDTNPDENGNPGILNAAANNGDVFITEITGDMTIGSIASTGTENSVNLKTEDGSIVESDKGSNDLIKDAVDAAIEAAKAQAKAEALEDQVQVLDNYVNTLDTVKQELQDALDNRSAAQSALDQAQAEEADAALRLEAARTELEELMNAETPDADAIAAQQEKVNSAQSDYDNAKAETQGKRDALIDAEEQLQNAVDSAGDKTFGTVPGLEEAASAEEALEALEQEKQLQEKELLDLTDALNQALQDAANKQAEATQKEQNASASGITADGDVNLEVNSSSGSATLGEKDNALGITAGGTTHIGTGEGTVLDSVDIESGGDLTIDSIVAEDEVNITAKGDIKGSEGTDTVDITAPSGSLSSLRGDIGTQEDPLKTALDRVNAYGDNIYLDNTKGLIIDSIIASGDPDQDGGNVHLIVDGDVMDGDAPAKPDDIDIIGGDVQIDASGDIGTKENPLEVESDVFGATGGDIHISSDGDVKVDKIVGSDVSISSGGKVTDQDDEDAIIADNLDIDAGVVGEEDNPLNVNVSGKLNIHAKYGYINLVNSYWALEYRTIIHEPTGIRVSGYISWNAELFVTDGFEHESCLVCKYLEILPASIVLARYHITITGCYHGMLYVQIPVEEALEGQIVTIAYCDDGKLVTIQVEVKDGFVSFFVDRLHTFVILDGQYHAVTESGHQMLASDETGEIVYADGL
ncbi:MAG: hypothetical protein SPI15_05205 [Candidatus Faecousia sp.]|nr:hypothetical protein [Candidatus Faecousia sp.]